MADENTAAPAPAASGSTAAPSPTSEGGSGGEATPAPKPAPRTIPGEGGLRDASMEETSLFEALGKDFDEGGGLDPVLLQAALGEAAPSSQTVLASTQTPGPKVEAPPSQQQPTTQEPKPQAQEPSKPEATPAAQPTGGTQQPQSAAPQLSVPWSPTVLKELESNRDVLVAALAKEFTLSDAEVTGLQTDAATVIPTLAGRIFYQASLHTLRMLQQFGQNLPGVLDKHIEARQRSGDVETRFFTTWPGLKDAKYANVIRQAAKMVKETEPGIAQDDLIQKVGRIVSAQFGLSGAQAPQQVQTPQGAAAVVSRQPAEAVVPAGASGGGLPKPNGAAADNPFEGLGLSFD